MISIDELTEQFGPTYSVFPFGECLIMQSSEFKFEWRLDLKKQGYDFHAGIQDDYPVVYVQLSKNVAPAVGMQTPSPIPVSEVSKMKTAENPKKKNPVPDEKILNDPELSDEEKKWLTKTDVFVRVEDGDVLLSLVARVQTLTEDYETLKQALNVVFPNLNGKVKALSENYETLSKSFAELKALYKEASKEPANL